MASTEYDSDMRKCRNWKLRLAAEAVADGATLECCKKQIESRKVCMLDKRMWNVSVTLLIVQACKRTRDVASGS
ncbi:hypothetical protein Tco_0652590 [Tanacetum coccineum]|uniref:Uncharacterized protein n=1 Tax=Tanacetum coccineum TaxID=301880 RepID=A0ABQ4WY09_9ASTR